MAKNAEQEKARRLAEALRANLRRRKVPRQKNKAAAKQPEKSAESES
jgi:hypothetical protein